MKIQFDNYKEFRETLMQICDNQVVFTTHVRDKCIEITKGELSKVTLEWLSKTKAKVYMGEV